MKKKTDSRNIIKSRTNEEIAPSKSRIYAENHIQITFLDNYCYNSELT